jgi:hypothetical protein
MRAHKDHGPSPHRWRPRRRGGKPALVPGPSLEAIACLDFCAKPATVRTAKRAARRMPDKGCGVAKGLRRRLPTPIQLPAPPDEVGRTVERGLRESRRPLIPEDLAQASRATDASNRQHTDHAVAGQVSFVGMGYCRGPCVEPHCLPIGGLLARKPGTPPHARVEG